MIVLYNLTILFLDYGLRFASLFHPKAKAFVTGRKGIFKKLEVSLRDNRSPLVWVHCASLGEFEQGRPVIEAIRKEHPQYKIVLTFFSPSGYEVRKNYGQADYIFYLPLDRPSYARRFVQLVRPTLAIFVKYEFWYHYAKALQAHDIPLISISSIFRRDQLFFSGIAKGYRKVLRCFSFFFVQNQESVSLLRSIGIDNCEQAGDTRFDRVHQVLKSSEPLPIVQAFKNNQRVFVLGSIWPEDLEVLLPLINENQMKFILAPHEISEDFLEELEGALQVRSIRYSRAHGEPLEDVSVLLIDNIGMLSRLYHYGEFAYVGGAFDKGLHNILEAAVYGIPILFGNKNYEKFQEARDLINRGGAFAVSDYRDLREKYEMLNVPESFLLACEVTRQYVEENLGATDKIMKYCKKVLVKKQGATIL